MALLVAGDSLLGELLVVAGLVVTLAAGRAAISTHVTLPGATAPSRPVLFFNPRSGGGKAERFALADEARKRGIEPIELKPGDDLETLVRGAIDRGADVLAMAGGDGLPGDRRVGRGRARAAVRVRARRHAQPLCALDLGVDRDDVVGALDAFVDGGERIVDLAEVNGRVFVNNVSLGLDAEAVQREGYRDAKLRTLLDTVPDTLGLGGSERDLRWTSPSGDVHHSGAMVLVSNNCYRLGRAVGSGTRPRIDDGLLGITVVAEPSAGRGGGRSLQRPLREWSAPGFEVDADRPVPAGIDGEALVLDPPLRFRIRPGVLRVRIARQHPGASPSAHGSRRYVGGRGRAGGNRPWPRPDTTDINNEEARVSASS